MVDVDLDHGTTLNKKIRNAQLAQYNFIFGEHFELCQRVRCIDIRNLCNFIVLLLCNYTNRVCLKILALGDVTICIALLLFAPRGSWVITYYVSVVGEKEENSNTVNVRTRDNKVHGEKSLDQVLEKFAWLAKERIRNSEDEF